MEPDSREFSWMYVTVNQLLTTGPCELIYACQSASSEVTDSYIYNGVDTNGQLVTRLEQAGAGMAKFDPKEPVYCRRGLYVDISTAAHAIFVQWRDLKHKGGES